MLLINHALVFCYETGINKQFNNITVCQEFPYLVIKDQMNWNRLKFAVK